ncbi:MAG: M28 family peptidase [Melioribacteraceae bacterium]
MANKKLKKKNTEIVQNKYWKWIPLIISILIVFVILFIVIRTPKPVFDGKRAYKELIKQVEFGPRISGTVSHVKTKEYLVSHLRKYADMVSEQTFDFTDKHDSTKIYKGVNIVASFNVTEEVSKRILLCAHWDSRPFADNDPDTTKHKLPVPAANDGASGVVVLLEMARLFAESKPKVGVDIVLFDLEDIGDEIDSSNANSPRNPFAIGSEMFVKSNPDYYPEYGILLDMVGDKELRIPKEAYSVSRAGNVVEKVWKAASVVGSIAFIDEQGGAVMDDHIAFLKKSIPVIDLIHLPFPKTWHTVNDKPEYCSSASLQQVGNVLVEVIYNEK